MKGGIIVLEGPDAAGKSTLAKMLHEQYDAVVIHAARRYIDFPTSPKPRMFHYHWAILLKAIDLAFRQHKLVVLDRHWLSEQVYGSLFRDGGKLPAAGRMFDRVLRRFGALNVICCPTDAKRHLGIYAKNIDGDHPYKLNQLEKIRIGYLDVLKGATRNLIFADKSYGKFLIKHPMLVRGDTFHYDMFEWTGLDPTHLIMNMLSQVQERQPAWVYNPDETNLAGAVTVQTKYVLVGDQTNPRKLKHKPWPMFDAGSSSYFLCEALDEADIPETDICVVNGCVHNPHKIPFISTMANVLVSVHGLKPIAMGNRASDAIRGAHYVIRHPSYAKRFNVRNYSDTLKGALST